MARPQVPLSGVRENPEHLELLETWMKSYRPEGSSSTTTVDPRPISRLWLPRAARE